MDDIQQAFGGQRPITPIEEAWHNEQRRKQFDVIRVANPTNKPFYFEYDTNQFKRVEANSTLDIPRYMAVRYVKHMKDKIINDMIQEKHDKEIEERKAKGFPGFKSKWEENEETYSNSSYPKTDDPELMTQVMDNLWVGIVYEFRQDQLPEELDPRRGEVDMKPSEVKIMDNLNSKRVAPTQQSVTHQQAPSFVPQSMPQPQQPYQSGFSRMNESLSSDEVTINE